MMVAVMVGGGQLQLQLTDVRHDRKHLSYSTFVWSSPNTFLLSYQSSTFGDLDVLILKIRPDLLQVCTVETTWFKSRAEEIRVNK